MTNSAIKVSSSRARKGAKKRSYFQRKQTKAASGQRLATTAFEISVDSPMYINRELSLLEFQRRVLAEAIDESNPLLERVKFLAIFFSNMNEFFMIRVAGLKKQVQAGISERSSDGMTPADQIVCIAKLSRDLLLEGQRCFNEQLLPALREQEIHLLQYDDLNKQQQEASKSYFLERVFPVLTPLAYDPGRPFPHISNLSMNLAVTVRDKKGISHFARMKLPESLPRLVPLSAISGDVADTPGLPPRHDFIWLEEVIKPHLNCLFPGMEIVEVFLFHVTRDADVEIQELEAADLLESIEEGIRRRRFGSVVRLIVDDSISEGVRKILVENMDIDVRDVYSLPSPFGLNHLMALYGIERADLKFSPYIPSIPDEFRSYEERMVFERVAQRDILLHHPYDSFIPVIDFLWAAAEDPKVLAIKQTLYRVGVNSEIVEALLAACLNGKQVSVLVELKARFDEESNIEWARKLEQEGVHVVYGLLGLKTHSKVALVVRNENDRIRHYVHLGTGNYNHVTAHQYEDMGMFTIDDEIGADVTDLFNFLTGYSDKHKYRKLLVAPVGLRGQLESLIKQETERARNGEKAHLIFKTNALVDRSFIQLLYEASQAGVRVDLIVRGICCLRPGIKGQSENIRVISVLGRFLEHSRIYYFYNGGQEMTYIGSADLMPRNLDHRVEVLFPVESPQLVRSLREDVLEHYLQDNKRARIMLEDGTYQRLTPESGMSEIDIQQTLMNRRSQPGG